MNTATANATETSETPDPGRATRVSPHLFLVMEGARGGSGGARVSLSTWRELRIGRGERRILERNGDSRASLTVPDARMSGDHARVVEDHGARYVEDVGSTNGTTVNGDAIARGTRQKLVDGDVLELGRTIFVFRELTGESAASAADLDLDPSRHPDPLATLDPDLARRLGVLSRVAASPIAVLLQGETGTGKEVLARRIHELSKRPGKFVAVNCGALPEGLVESQLFGHLRGSFSGAVRDELGLVRTANQGTLLLDEIGDLPPSSQAALLRMLQESEVLPVGATEPSKVDVRILAATHQPLEQLMTSGTFRRDLYARLAGYSFSLPPLRDRKVDIGVLAGTMIANGSLASEDGLRIHREALRAMLRYDWPLNIRELAQCLHAASALAGDGVVTTAELPDALLRRVAREPAESGTLSDEDEALRRELHLRFTEARGNVSEVARAMGKARQQIQRWVRRFSIDADSFRR